MRRREEELMPLLVLGLITVGNLLCHLPVGDLIKLCWEIKEARCSQNLETTTEKD